MEVDSDPLSNVLVSNSVDEIRWVTFMTCGSVVYLEVSDIVFGNERVDFIYLLDRVKVIS